MNALKREQQTVRELYVYICNQEGLKALPVKFKKVGKGGACLVYMTDRITREKTPLQIEVDLGRLVIGAAWAICHEVAHQIMVTQSNNSTHCSAFKKEEARLVNKYTRCEIANRLIF